MDEPSELQISLEDDFVDFEIPLESYTRCDDGVQQIVARGRHGSATLSFLVSLGAIWERQDVEDSDLVLYWGRAEFVSLGAESTAFVRLLDEAYGTSLNHNGMRERAPFLAVGLSGDPARLECEPVKMKLFFESDDEALYAEFYLNIDVCARSVQFHEKDPDYRRGVVLSLSAEL